MTDFLSVLGSAATVALIVFVTRWLLAAKGTQFPKVRGDRHIYGVKWPVRVVALGGAGMFAAIIIEFRNDLIFGRGRIGLFIFLAPLLLGLWLASGSIITDQTGIRKKVLWFSRSLRWEEITEIHYYEKKS